MIFPIVPEYSICSICIITVQLPVVLALIANPTHRITDKGCLYCFLQGCVCLCVRAHNFSLIKNPRNNTHLNVKLGHEAACSLLKQDSKGWNANGCESLNLESLSELLILHTDLGIRGHHHYL